MGLISGSLGRVDAVWYRVGEFWYWVVGLVGSLSFSIRLLDLGRYRFIDVGSKWGCWMCLGLGLELLSFYVRLLNVEVCWCYRELLLCVFLP